MIHTLCKLISRSWKATNLHLIFWNHELQQLKFNRCWKLWEHIILSIESFKMIVFYDLATFFSTTNLRLLNEGTNWEQIQLLFISSILPKWNWQQKLVSIIEENAMTSKIPKWLIYDQLDHEKQKLCENLFSKNRKKHNPRMHCRLISKLFRDKDYP